MSGHVAFRDFVETKVYIEHILGKLFADVAVVAVSVAFAFAERQRISGLADVTFAICICLRRALIDNGFRKHESKFIWTTSAAQLFASEPLDIACDQATIEMLSASKDMHLPDARVAS